MNTKQNNLLTQNKTSQELKMEQFMNTKRDNLQTLNETVYEH